MLSIVEKRNQVTFPAHTGERVYMQPFTKRDGLPKSLRRWQLTVDQMLEGIDTDGPIYLMVDQKRVSAGAPHRRPGIHVDGNWHPSIQAHGHPRPPGHIHAGTWDNPGDGRWKHHSYSPEAIVLASSAFGARAYAGEFGCKIGPGGECSELDLSRLMAVDMDPFCAWVGNVTMLHESLPVPRDTVRTVVRLNVPGWEPPNPREQP